MITANGTSGVVHDFYCYNAEGKVWNGSTFVVWVDGDYTTYRVVASERGTSGAFTCTEPVGTASWEMRVQAGTLAGSYVVWSESLITEQIKADPQLGTADGGLVANAAASKAKTDLLGTGTVMLSAPVSGDGELLELILDTDYLAANGRALEWTFDQIPNITTSATGKFGLKNSENGTEVYVNSSGAVTDLGGGTFKVSFDIPNTALAGLSPEEYDWSVEVLEGSYKITIARNRQRKTRVNIVEKQT